SIFFESIFSFRRNRSAHGIIQRAKEYYVENYRTVVDVDLKKYFDTVNRDRLIHYAEEHIQDKIIFRLICKFLRSGVTINQELFPIEIGTPQGGNSSSLLS